MNLTFAQYQTGAVATASDPNKVRLTPEQTATAMSVLALAAGVAQVADTLKKQLFHTQTYNPDLLRSMAYEARDQAYDLILTLENQSVVVEPPTTPTGNYIVCNLLGLVGEAGEVVSLYGQASEEFDAIHNQAAPDFQKELGDVLWYAALTARTCGLSMGDVAQANLNKLAKRYPEGFDPTASVRKEDEN